jgi:hypothetical protein
MFTPKRGLWELFIGVLGYITHIERADERQSRQLRIFYDLIRLSNRPKRSQTAQERGGRTW